MAVLFVLIKDLIVVGEYQYLVSLVVEFLEMTYFFDLH